MEHSESMDSRPTFADRCEAENWDASEDSEDREVGGGTKAESPDWDDLEDLDMASWLNGATAEQLAPLELVSELASCANKVCKSPSKGSNHAQWYRTILGWLILAKMRASL